MKNLAQTLSRSQGVYYYYYAMPVAFYGEIMLSEYSFAKREGGVRWQYIVIYYLEFSLKHDGKELSTT